MMYDSFSSFLLPSAGPLSMIAADSTAVVIGTVDFSGVGSGNPITNVIGNAALFGENPGVGRYRPEIILEVDTSFTTGNAATANFALQYAPDNGSNAPGAYETASETGPKAAASLTAGTVLRLDWAPAPIGTPRPRFARLVMLPADSTHFTAGKIGYAISTPTADNNTVKQTPRNYKVA